MFIYLLWMFVQDVVINILSLSPILATAEGWVVLLVTQIQIFSSLFSWNNFPRFMSVTQHWVWLFQEGWFSYFKTFQHTFIQQILMQSFSNGSTLFALLKCLLIVWIDKPGSGTSSKSSSVLSSLDPPNSPHWSNLLSTFPSYTDINNKYSVKVKKLRIFWKCYQKSFSE